MRRSNAASRSREKFRFRCRRGEKDREMNKEIMSQKKKVKIEKGNRTENKRRK